MNFIIRKIESKDNAQIATIIRAVFEELNAPKEGTAYADSCLDNLSEVYKDNSSIYFVVEVDGQILGGAGLAPLEKGNKNVCELQKMYFNPKLRGKGIAEILINKCLIFAKETGFQQCYLETLPIMEAAQKLYKKVGFEYLKSSLGNTGHMACHVFMLKKL